MKKTILALTFATMSISAFAGLHPIARTAAVATSDHPVAMAAASSGNGAHPVARTALVAGSDHPLAAAVVTAH
ncbi:hypothetical protein WH357_19400 [Enterobacter ludwigii]